MISTSRPNNKSSRDVAYVVDLNENNEGIDSFMRFNKQKYSTTSSVFAEHTIANPNYDQVLFCIAAIMQAQIFEDDLSDLSSADHPEFDVVTTLCAEYGGHLEHVPECILNHETLNDTELREKIIGGVVPTVDTIFRFINFLSVNAKYSLECNIISLIYVNRLTTAACMPLTMKNWRGIWISTIILAQKVWDDNPLTTSSFSHFLPSVTKQILRHLEMRTFSLMDYSTGVKPSLYVKYYFELRHLFSEIMGPKSDTENLPWAKPLSLVQSKIIEDRTSKHGRVAKKSSKKSSSTTASFDFSSITSKSQSTDSSISSEGDNSSSQSSVKFSPASLLTPLPSGSIVNHPATSTTMASLSHLATPNAKSRSAVMKSSSISSTSSRTSSGTVSTISKQSSPPSVLSVFKQPSKSHAHCVEDVTLIDTSRFVIS
eukprot:gene6195-8532_t